MDQVTQQLPSDAIALPERRAISSEAHAEIKKLWEEFIAKTRVADTARHAFIAFVNITKDQMGLPENEKWEIDGDATYFEQVTAQSAEKEQDNGTQETIS